MRVIGNNRKIRTVYAWQEGDEFLLSPFPEAKGGRRPIDRFDNKEQLEASIDKRGCEVRWLTS